MPIRALRWGLPLLIAVGLAGPSCEPLLRATFVAGGFASPIFLTAPAGDPRLFVVERAGRIRIVDANRNVVATPFLDISAKVGTAGEGGLLGLAFARDYAHSGQFYVYYTDANINSVLSRFVVDPRDPDLADPSSEKVLLTVAQIDQHHKGGTIAFSPKDGYLYWALGDGGLGNDPNNNAQNLQSLLGKVLRLDVGGGAQSGYAIPATNPFRTIAGARPEIWDLGLRNPFRFSFDRASGNLWIGDVGESDREEVDFERPITGPHNYGWKIQEGTLCHLPQPGLPCEDPAHPNRFTFPVYEYDHSVGCAITGGVVYRGSAPFLKSHYLFADYCSNRIWALVDGTGEEITGFLVPDQGQISGIVDFGEDGFGEVYLVSLNSGSIHRID
jgi:glucose/arabinose dehydrogenase